MTSAILYARFSPRPNADQEKTLRSLAPDEERDSISKQLARCRDFCQRQGWAIASEHTDEALSGAEEDRPGLWDAVAALKRDYVLVIDKMDRLARDKYLFVLIEREVQKKRARIVSAAGEGTDADTAECELIRTIMQALAVYQRRIIKARTSAAMRRHQAHDRRMSRTDRCPWGKQADWQGPKLEKRDKDGKLVSSLPARLIDNPAELAILERIRRMAAEGMGARAITTWLNNQGIPCRRARRWHLTTVRRLLKKMVPARNGHAAADAVQQAPAGATENGFWA